MPTLLKHVKIVPDVLKFFSLPHYINPAASRADFLFLPYKTSPTRLSVFPVMKSLAVKLTIKCVDVERRSLSILLV